ncbi:Na+/H+ antiporter subunit E [Natrialba aegyptia]|uniref:Cation antiporter n=1 Tax=Natrialba aegyptia DSM 13077 TaxID=1227491 RepID=M0B3Q9_9EURY|nr:Na+/H+ antiporter subunit E [Natrialba aegyptia]ELZ04309.1 cation antiporter [Natrialba aegyptia DSM 13077]
MTVRTWPVAGIVFAVLWIFVRGIELAPAALVGQFLAGIVVGLPIAFLFRRLYGKYTDLGRLGHASPYAGRYLAAFSWELVRANLDVAYRVLSPRVKIEPEVILVPLRVQTVAGITLIANSITLTPGTVALDHDPDENALYVHAIDGRDPESIAAPIRTWETYALEMFDEELSPSDPPPAIITGREDDDTNAARERTHHDRGEDDHHNGMPNGEPNSDDQHSQTEADEDE